MAVYFIFTFNVADEEQFAPYRQGVGALIRRHEGQVLAADSNATVLEGVARQVNVVVRFPSQEDAMAFYDDPDYQPLKQLRISTTTETTAIMVKEFSPSH
jgi:uncharacterized protein (DUF1330 family)